MTETQATNSPAKGSASTTEVTPYGIIKRIRYMVNSTPEFMEVLHGVNQMYCGVEDVNEHVTLQRDCQVDITPLPHSESKFILSFTVPSDLLGSVGQRKPRKLDLADFYDPDDKPQIIKKPPKMLFSYEIGSLFDLNLAFYNFQATLAPSVPSAQWSRVRRSIEVVIRPRQTPEDKLNVIIIAEINTAVEA